VHLIEPNNNIVNLRSQRTATVNEEWLV